MIKLFIYVPLHVLNMWIAHLSPRWIFKVVYAPANNIVREQEALARNKIRKANYYTKKWYNNE